MDMDTKLTIKLNKEIIDKAKVYSKTRKISLSKLIETYLNLITTKEKTNEEYISPLVQELSGIVQIPDDFNIKKTYTDYLFNKYK